MEELTREQKEKYAVLQDYLRSLKSVAVAFSSGVDSTFLLKVAKDTLGDQVIAKEQGMENIVEGSNTDDNGDYRPRLQAVAELDIKSPLRYAQMSKDDIRALSKYLNLPTWEKQSFACLSSRFVYGETITQKKLGMVDKAEQLLLDLGFHQVRVRIHGGDMETGDTTGTIARIEVEPKEFAKLMEPATREQIANALKSYGFTYVTLDLFGYRTGSMNATLK